MLLPREHLPLAHIDFAASNGDLPQSRFYESYIHVLDLESRLGPVPVVLIARNELRGTTYALERQSNGLYVICKLGSWVDLESLAQKAAAVRYEQLYPAKNERAEHRSLDALTTPQLHVEQKEEGRYRGHSVSNEETCEIPVCVDRWTRNKRRAATRA